MGIRESGIIGVEGLGDTQGQCGLHRNITQIMTHNPAREDRAKKLERYQLRKPRSRDHSCGQRASESTFSIRKGDG